MPLHALNNCKLHGKHCVKLGVIVQLFHVKPSMCYKLNRK
jgi:hypothetical protein